MFEKVFAGVGLIWVRLSKKARQKVKPVMIKQLIAHYFKFYMKT